MASQDGNDGAGSEPNLELPSLFGRRRKKSQDPEQPTPAEPPPAATTRPLRPVEGEKRLPPSPPPRRGPELTYDAPREPTPVDEPTTVLTAPAPPPPDPVEEPVEKRRRPSMPSLPRRLATVVTGVAVALTGIAMLWLFLQGCTAVRGVNSCGGFGLVGISVTLVAQVVVAAALLTALRVAEPRSTAALGVGLSATVAMVLFYASTPALAMAIAMLVLTPVAYVVAAGVTTAEVETRD